MSVKKDSYICIEAFMVNELKLSGTELIVYAIIYGFSQDGKSFFSGSHSYIAEWCGCSERSVWNHINGLIEKGLLDKKTKRDGSVTFCYYRAIRPETSTENISDGKVFPRKNFHSATENISVESPSTTENFSDNILDNIYTSNTLDFGKPRKQKKLPLSEREPENDLERIEKRFVNNFEELHKRGIIPSEKPVVNWGQCRRLEKERLDNVGLDPCLAALDRAMDDPFVVQKGYSLAVILSATVFNGLVNGGAKRAIDVADSVNLQDVPF